MSKIMKYKNMVTTNMMQSSYVIDVQSDDKLPINIKCNATASTLGLWLRQIICHKHAASEMTVYSGPNYEAKRLRL